MSRPDQSRIAWMQNIVAMRAKFPGLRFKRLDGVPAWRGELRPFTSAPPYNVQIAWRDWASPRVKVTRPALQTRAPHVYRDGSLCLFFPDDRSWQPGMLISDTIVPWTAEWLMFYEYWMDTGKWWGPEAPHSCRKRPS